MITKAEKAQKLIDKGMATKDACKKVGLTGTASLYSWRARTKRQAKPGSVYVLGSDKNEITQLKLKVLNTMLDTLKELT
jgi:transposase-like protein